jgi:hypothetical protein
MMTGTRWHAVSSTYLSREYTFMKTIQQMHRPRASPCQRANWSPWTTSRLTADSTGSRSLVRNAERRG